MYELHVEAEFTAAHAIRIAGRVEPAHEHIWRVRATVAGENLDDDGLLCDFHLVQASLRDAIGPFHHSALNDTPPFDRLNPTAEHVARRLAESLGPALADSLPAGVRLAAIEVTEAPGCSATFRFSVED